MDIFGKDKEGKRVRKQLEVDFVVNQGNQRYYIQVAYDMTSEEKQTQEFNSLRNIPDSFKKIVIVDVYKRQTHCCASTSDLSTSSSSRGLIAFASIIDFILS